MFPEPRSSLTGGSCSIVPRTPLRYAAEVSEPDSDEIVAELRHWAAVVRASDFSFDRVEHPLVNQPDLDEAHARIFCYLIWILARDKAVEGLLFDTMKPEDLFAWDEIIDRAAVNTASAFAAAGLDDGSGVNAGLFGQRVAEMLQNQNSTRELATEALSWMMTAGKLAELLRIEAERNGKLEDFTAAIQASAVAALGRVEDRSF